MGIGKEIEMGIRKEIEYRKSEIEDRESKNEGKRIIIEIRKKSKEIEDRKSENRGKEIKIEIRKEIGRK